MKPIHILVPAILLALASGCDLEEARVPSGLEGATSGPHHGGDLEPMDNSGENQPGETGALERTMLSDEEWRERLTPEQYHVLRQKGTERAFTGKYWNTKSEGTFVCAGCGNEIFSSGTKFDSGTGWPSFWAPVDPQSISTEDDYGRTEVLCSRCGGHLGHVFEDGPEPTHMRYCLNSVALDLKEKEESSEQPGN